MKRKLTLILICGLMTFSVFLSSALQAQSPVNRDTMLLAAKEIIRETTYCALVTIDSSGQPQVRTMNPFPLNDEFLFWFATSRTSRKVKELKNNPRVCVYFADHVKAKGYVNITGAATVIDDKELLLKMKRAYWEGIPNWQDTFVLIKIVPKTLEVINYKHRLTNDPKTFKAPTISF